MNILITGIAGCGKSTIAKKLKEMGYVSYDIEGIKGLFSLYDKTSGEIIEDYNSEDLEIVKKMDWKCNPIKLNKLLKKNSNTKLNFYCGMLTNQEEIFPLFDIKLLLVANNKATLERLRKRKESWEYGSTEEVRQHIIDNKSNWEKELLKKGLYEIDASVSVEKVAENIFSNLQQII